MWPCIYGQHKLDSVVNKGVVGRELRAEVGVDLRGIKKKNWGEYDRNTLYTWIKLLGNKKFITYTNALVFWTH